MIQVEILFSKHLASLGERGLEGGMELDMGVITCGWIKAVPRIIPGREYGVMGGLRQGPQVHQR